MPTNPKSPAFSLKWLMTAEDISVVTASEDIRASASIFIALMVSKAASFQHSEAQASAAFGLRSQAQL